MKFTEAETLGYKTRLENLLAMVKGLIKEMDVVEANCNLSNDQKLEELKKLKKN